MPKEKLASAIVAAADVDYSKFKDSISGIVEDKFRVEIGKTAQRIQSEMFRKAAPTTEEE